jgi:hypothetical protein
LASPRRSVDLTTVDGRWQTGPLLRREVMSTRPSLGA